MRERYLKVAELSQRFSVSQMSIRRDLHLLEQQGLLRRVHGGMVATPLARLGLEISPQLIAHLNEQASVKAEIACAAAALVQPGDHLIFDNGSLSYLTACALSGDLLTQGDLAVITNSIPITLELAPWPGVETILLGGVYEPASTMSTTGATTLRSLDGLHADKMFLTAATIDLQDGVVLMPEHGESRLAKRMIAACSRVILLAPGSKVGRAVVGEALCLSAGDTLVTDQECPAGFVSALGQHGIDVIQAQKLPRKVLCL